MVSHGKKRKPTEQSGMGNIYYDEKTIETVANIISTVAAAALLVGAIAILQRVKSYVKLRLGLIAVFTTLFAISVSIFTNSRRAEVFAASAGSVSISGTGI
jgi:predicted lysophospholipase L1 biosynthesis ABC-type transport system permease subunit